MGRVRARTAGFPTCTHVSPRFFIDSQTNLQRWMSWSPVEALLNYSEVEGEIIKDGLSVSVTFLDLIL